MTGQVVLTGRESRQLLAAGASGRCERCGRLISRGRAAWSRDEYGVPLCEGCEPEPMPCRRCDGFGEWEEMRTPSPIGRRMSPDFVVVRCEWCDGTGEEPCACCREAAAVVETDLGPYCARCASAEEV